MNRSLKVLAVFVTLSSVAVCAQSLGDAARKSRSDKPKAASSKVYTNDDLPSVGAVEADANTRESRDDTSKSETKKEASNEDRKKVDAEWRKKIDDQKKKLADLEKELDLLDREHKLRAAAFYADAGLRLRDDRNWAEQERKYQADIEDRKKQIAEAKQALEDTQDRARKAGVSKALD